MAAEIYVAKYSTTTTIKLYSVVYDSYINQVYIHETQWHRAHTVTKMHCPWTKELAYCMCKTTAVDCWSPVQLQVWNCK